MSGDRLAHYALFLSSNRETVLNDNGFKVWMCIICGWIYNEEAGAPEEGLVPGTRWSQIPDDWVCPDCGATKDDFEMIEL